jgi:NADP-reducing hydrogenase subunit HndD
MNYCNVMIDNKKITVPEGTKILEAACLLNINIPTLCYHPDQKVKANCRICVVQERGKNTLTSACTTAVWDGADIVTNSNFVRDAQKGILELILANHPQDCLHCIRNGKCELQDISKKFNVFNSNLTRVDEKVEIDDSNPSIVREPSKCIKCNRCAEACEIGQGLEIVCQLGRSKDTTIGPAFGQKLSESLCIYCGQCTAACPVGAVHEKDNTEDVWNAINDPGKHVIVQVAPAVRVSIGDEFGLPAGKNITGKMVEALKRIGFDKVFDTNFTADLTILEEGTELIYRIQNKGVLPMITSCCPGWVNYIEGYFPQLIDHVSTCKSPQQMFGAVSKSYYAEKIGIDPKNIFTVSIMPCTAKKYEAAREETNVDGVREVDAVLTTRELARMINAANIDFNNIDESEFDLPFGITSGAGVIFGATGGVMEAALRTVYERLTDKELKDVNFRDVRGMTDIKEATVVINDQSVKVAVAHGISNAKKILDQIENGESDYTFVEIMACPGGCIGGGGQPIGSTLKVKNKRINQIYKIDEYKAIRKSHENPAIIELYKEYLEEPLGHLSHKLLHTTYFSRKNK